MPVISIFMTDEELIKLRYPTGKFTPPGIYNTTLAQSFISELEKFPALIREAVQNLDEHLLEKPYRPGGWTIRQVVHHCADSHMNAFIRHKLTLTEDQPTIKTYFENLWAELPDVKKIPVEHSLSILEGLHFRWVALLRSLNETDFQKKFYHPESKRHIVLFDNLALYAWHCKHHLGHIFLAKGNGNPGA